MTYTGLAFEAVVVAIVMEHFVTRRGLLKSKRFWASYAIILPFQLLTNWWLTSRGILTYAEDAIIGTRIAAAPVEDLFFGFAMITMTISLWIYWGKRGVQRN